VVLEMRRARGGVVREAGERVVDALRREGRERPLAVARAGPAVDDVVVGVVEVRHVEDVAQRRCSVSSIETSTWAPSPIAKCSGMAVSEVPTRTGIPWFCTRRPICWVR
jgi:hypothetical protein